MTVRKVLHVIPSVGPLRGGPTTLVRQLAKDLVRAGIETHLATTNDNAEGFLDVPLGVPVGDEGVTYWYFPQQIKFYGVSWPLASWLSRNIDQFDVVHIHALFSFATLPAAFCARRRAVPYIIRPLGTLNEWGMTNRRPWLKQASFRVLESRVVKHAALMHYTSDAERHEASKLGVTTRSVVIPNAVSEIEAQRAERGAFRQKLELPGGRALVLFMSRLDEKKGLDILLRAFVTLRSQLPSALLVVAGDGVPDYVRRIRSEARELGLGDDNVLWAGFLSGNDRRAALADADVFVLPSYSENFGISVAEAMAVGVPVVVSDQVAIHHEIAYAGAGIVTPCDPAQLAQALATVLSKPQLAAAMGAAGAELVRRCYSTEAITRQVVDAYERVTGGASVVDAHPTLGAIGGNA